MTSLVQSCVGPNATAVTSANASGGNQFTNVNQGGTGVVHNWDNTHTIHGNATALLRTLPAVSATAYEEWTNTVVPATNNGYYRHYIYITAAPTVNTRLFTFGNTTGTVCSNCVIGSNGTLRMADTSGTLIGTATTATVPLNQWVRVEADITGISGASSTTACRMYSGANLETTTPDTNGTGGGSSTNTTGQVGNIRNGMFAATVETAAWSIWVSDIAYSDVAQPGPLAGASLLPQQIRMRRPAALTRIASQRVGAVYGR